MRNYILVAFMLFFAIQVKAQKINPVEAVKPIEEQILIEEAKTSMVLDSTIINDMKLLIINDRLYAKGGLIETIINQASKEKAETGNILKASETQAFIDGLNALYKKYALHFIKVDTVYIYATQASDEAEEIKVWQQSVLKDPEIKNVTSLTVWEEKSKRLEKLLYYQSQLKK
jgi:hypothetical protein